MRAKRFGPLQLRDGAICVGDRRGAAMRLTETGVELLRRGEEPRLLFWEELAEVRLQLNTTPIRAAAAMSWTVAVLVTALSGEIEDIEKEKGAVLLRLRNGEAVKYKVSTHNFMGYWDKSVRATEQLLRGFINNPESRELLRQPAAVLEQARELATRK